ncbi:hypothetical protein LINGRAHAP2_LOCUS8100, partial [Linum grandiflorum]
MVLIPKMKIMVWNVQGLESAWKSENLITLWRQTHSSILILSETKNPQAWVRRKQKKRLTISNFGFVNIVGRSGGLAMARIDSLVGTSHFSCDLCIMVEFTDVNGILVTVL